MRRKFSYLVKRFLAWARQALHKTTVNVYRHYFQKFLEEVGDLAVNRIKPARVTAWAKTWHASQAIVRLFRWALDDAGLIKSNPLARVKHPPKGERKRIITRGEQALMLRACDPELRALLIGYRETFARPGELRAATWGDVYPKTTRANLRTALAAGDASIVLWDYKNRKQRRTPNEPRIILLSPRVGRLLCRLMRGELDTAAKIFQTAAGKGWTPNAVRCRLRKLRSRLNLKRDARGENLVPYTFRHTGATEATAAGIRDRILADLLGHTETSTTRRYHHLDVGHVRAPMKTFWRARKPR